METIEETKVDVIIDATPDVAEVIQPAVEVIKEVDKSWTVERKKAASVAAKKRSAEKKAAKEAASPESIVAKQMAMVAKEIANPKDRKPNYDMYRPVNEIKNIATPEALVPMDEIYLEGNITMVYKLVDISNNEEAKTSKDDKYKLVVTKTLPRKVGYTDDFKIVMETYSSEMHYASKPTEAQIRDFYISMK